MKREPCPDTTYYFNPWKYPTPHVQPKSYNRKRRGMKPGSLVASAQDEKELLILYRAIKASKAATAGRASALRALVEAIA